MKTQSELADERVKVIQEQYAKKCAERTARNLLKKHHEKNKYINSK